MRTLGFSALCLAAAFWSICTRGQSVPDYLISPVPANLVVDASTTFLVNLTTVKTQADFALGNPQITVDTNAFIPGAGYRGNVTLATPGNFPTNPWTVEMIVLVPYSASTNTSIELGDWIYQDGPNYADFELVLDRNLGPRTKMYFPENNFYVYASACSNGRSIQKSATDRFVYLAFGCDFAAQQCMASAREVTGDLINDDINFTPFPLVLNTNWAGGAQEFAHSMPPAFTLGNAGAGVQIQAIRLSSVFRSNLFQIAPVLAAASSTNWIPQTINPLLVQTQSVTRNVGYPGFNNFIPMPVNESYLPMYLGGPPLTLQLTNVPVGLYSFYLFGQTASNGRAALNQVWNPCPMDFQAVDAGGTVLARGRLLSKQGFAPRRLQGFHFHLDTNPTNVTVMFQIAATNAMETNYVLWINLFDELAASPNAAVKTSQNFAPGPTNQDTGFTLARQQRDDAIWAALPPLNTQLQLANSDADNQVPAFDLPPTNIDSWVTLAWTNAPPPSSPYWASYIPAYTFTPLDFLDTNNNIVFPQSEILANVPWPGPYPDDGTGHFFSKAAFPWLATSIYNTQRAELLGYRYIMFFGAIVNAQGSQAGADYPQQYFNTGVATNGHDGAMALVRLAYDWPAMEANLHETRYSTQNPDLVSGDDWTDSGLVNGKIRYVGWSGTDALWLFQSYDQLFPYINNNQIFASAVHRYVSWVNTPQDVIRLLDRYLVFSSVRDVSRGLIDGSAGVATSAAQLLGPGPYTSNLFNLTKLQIQTYPLQGTFQEMYGTALSRSGVEYIGSYEVYAYGTAESLISQASEILAAKQAGVVPLMDISDVSRYPKVRGAANFLLDMWVAGGYPFMVGDASGGPHFAPDVTLRLNAASNALSQAFYLDGDTNLAWVLKNRLGSADPNVAAASLPSMKDPVLHAVSRVVPDWGADLEMTPGESNPLNKTAATLRLGLGSGHVHSDFLDLNFFAMGLPMAVDLANRDDSGDWSLPSASWSFVHNHAISSTNVLDNPNSPDLSQSGEPWLRAFAPPVLRASYVDKNGTNTLDRDLIMMEVRTGSEVFYAVDVQRLYGNYFHTWCFHGCESSNLVLNVPLTARLNVWLKDTYPGSMYAGPSTNLLQATWTMTRQGGAFPYSAEGGGVLSTVAAEQAVLGSSYDSNRPPANIRATLLGRTNDIVMQGSVYSAPYNFCFPFLWTQTSNEVYSVYPAIYEWYRGGVPVVSNAVILQNDPLQVEVTTTSGQVDDYESTTNHFLAVSHDTNGVRWAKLSGFTLVNQANLALNPATNYLATILTLSHVSRTLTTSIPLPDNPAVTVGNPGRQIFLQLTGSGTNFTWADDLLVQEGLLTSIHVTATNTVLLTSDQSVLFDGYGNRNSSSMTVTTEDGLWQFRGGRAVQSPPGAPLVPEVFNDANGDGLVDMKTYEIGAGDQISLPVDVTIERASGGWRVRTNVPLTGQVNSTPLNLPSSTNWQYMDNAGKYRPAPPVNLRLLTGP